ncbi:MAG: DUF4116 domain-containing protein [Parachlamydiaceae bacterium]|nr:DUF4116 domain-containing protein [Parachlamydiaceae bacterium]
MNSYEIREDSKFISIKTISIGTFHIKPEGEGQGRKFTIEQTLNSASIITVISAIFFSVINILTCRMFKSISDRANKARKECQTKYVAKIDKEFLTDSTKMDGELKSTKKVVKLLKRNVEFMLKIVRHDGKAIELANTALWNNIKLIKAAIKTYPQAIDKAGLLTQEKQFMEELMRDDIEWYKKAHEYLKNDKDFTVKYLQGKGSIKNIPTSFLHDNEVVIEALKIDGMALEFVSEYLKKDSEVVKHAVVKNGLALRFAHPDLRKVVQIVSYAMFNNLSAMQYVDPILYDNKVIIGDAVYIDSKEKNKNNTSSFRYATERLKGDKKFVLEMVAKCGTALEFASDALKNDREVVLAAVTKSPSAIKFASPALQADEAIKKLSAEGALK